MTCLKVGEYLRAQCMKYFTIYKNIILHFTFLVKHGYLFTFTKYISLILKSETTIRSIKKATLVFSLKTRVALSFKNTYILE